MIEGYAKIDCTDSIYTFLVSNIEVSVFDDGTVALYDSDETAYIKVSDLAKISKIANRYLKERKAYLAKVEVKDGE